MYIAIQRSILCTVPIHFRFIKVFRTRGTEHAFEMELTSIDLPHRVTEDSRRPRLQTLANYYCYNVVTRLYSIINLLIVPQTLGILIVLLTVQYYLNTLISLAFPTHVCV